MYYLKNLLVIGLLILTIILVTEVMSPNETRDEYVKEGHSWSRVLLGSSVVGLISGVITMFLATQIKDPAHQSLAVGMSAVSGFVTYQAICTDVKVLMINRQLLRYMTAFNITTVGILRNSGVEGYSSVFLLTLIMSIIITLFVTGIGASDGRAMMATLPAASYLFGDAAIVLLIVSFLIASVYLYVEKKKDRKLLYEKYKDEEMIEGLSEEGFKKAVAEVSNTDEFGRPMGPFILAPFHILFLLLPIL